MSKGRWVLLLEGSQDNTTLVVPDVKDYVEFPIPQSDGSYTRELYILHMAVKDGIAWRFGLPVGCEPTMRHLDLSSRVSEPLEVETNGHRRY